MTSYSGGARNRSFWQQASFLAAFLGALWVFSSKPFDVMEVTEPWFLGLAGDFAAFLAVAGFLAVFLDLAGKRSCEDRGAAVKDGGGHQRL